MSPKSSVPQAAKSDSQVLMSDSRGTSHTFPFGALFFASENPNAALLAQRWIAALEVGSAPSPGTVDDRYFSYFYMPAYALAFWQALSRRPQWVDAGAAPSLREDLPGSGLLIVRREGWSVTVSRRLGGAVAIERPNETPTYHLGYEVTSGGGARYSSAAWSTEAYWQPATSSHTSIECQFQAASSALPLRRLMIPFQVAVHGLRSTLLAEVFQSLIKKRMIAPKKELPLRLARRVDMNGPVLTIEDTLTPGPTFSKIRSLKVAKSISMHSPSARQDPGVEIAIPDASLVQARDILNGGTAAHLVWKWSPSAPPQVNVFAGGDAHVAR